MSRSFLIDFARLENGTIGYSGVHWGNYELNFLGNLCKFCIRFEHTGILQAYTYLCPVARSGRFRFHRGGARAGQSRNFECFFSHLRRLRRHTRTSCSFYHRCIRQKSQVVGSTMPPRGVVKKVWSKRMSPFFICSKNIFYSEFCFFVTCSRVNDKNFKPIWKKIVLGGFEKFFLKVGSRFDERFVNRKRAMCYRLREEQHAWMHFVS